MKILQRLETQFREACLARARVFEWCKTSERGERQREGGREREREREREENMLHNRKPRTSILPSNIDCSNVLIRDNRHIIVKELASVLNTSVGSVESRVKMHLHYRTVRGLTLPENPWKPTGR